MADMTLSDRIQQDMTAAMKARDSVATSTLRMVRAAIMNAEVAGDTAVTLTDDQVIGVLQSEAKRRAEAAEVYEQAGRTEQANAERAELAVIEQYLPEKMSDDELAAVVDEVVAAAGDDVGPKQMGQIIGAVRAKVGPAADGGAIAAAVKQRLASNAG